MKNIIIILSLAFVLVMLGCSNESDTEKYQQTRDEVVNVHDKVAVIDTDSLMIGSIARPTLLGDYLIIADPKSVDNPIHIFDKNNFKRLMSTGIIGQGPDEITNMGYIGTDDRHHQFYLSDHGKQKIFSYNIDSLLHAPDYRRAVKLEMNKSRFPSKYVYMSDTLSIALLIEPTSASSFNQCVAKWNMEKGTFVPMKYKHPDVKKKRIDFAIYPEKRMYAECNHNCDLMTLCDFDGNLICNVYGPSWNGGDEKNMYHYGTVAFCGDHIVASYSGQKTDSRDYAPTKLLVFDLEGNYLKTLDIGYHISSFCFDKGNDRLILSLDDIYQFAYLSLKDLF